MATVRTINVDKLVDTKKSPGKLFYSDPNDIAGIIKSVACNEQRTLSTVGVAALLI